MFVSRKYAARSQIFIDEVEESNEEEETGSVLGEEVQESKGVEDEEMSEEVRDSFPNAKFPVREKTGKRSSKASFKDAESEDPFGLKDLLKNPKDLSGVQGSTKDSRSPTFPPGFTPVKTALYGAEL